MLLGDLQLRSSFVKSKLFLPCRCSLGTGRATCALGSDMLLRRANHDAQHTKTALRSDSCVNLLWSQHLIETILLVSQMLHQTDGGCGIPCRFNRAQ
jgi:hypothetical protein